MTIEADLKEYKPHNIPSRMGMKVPADKEKGGRRTGRMNNSSSDCSPNTSNTSNSTSNVSSPAKNGSIAENSLASSNSFTKELARLQFFGAGPKMAGLPSEKSVKEKTRGIKLNFEYDPLAKYMCQNCGKGEFQLTFPLRFFHFKVILSHLLRVKMSILIMISILLH